MYFQIENTPENIKRTRKKEVVQDDVQEECPRLVLAPFSRPPQVIFDNVLIGTTCRKELEILNPLKQAQQITIGKSLPPGLVLQLPGEYLDIEPETCYCVILEWTPTQITTLRETLRFTNDSRGRYDVCVILKSVMKLKGKNNQPKLKISPGKIKKKSGKRSPVAIYKKKIETICNTKTIKKTVHIAESTHYKIVNPTSKENVYTNNDYSIDSDFKTCPFGSPGSLDFNSTEIFSNVIRSNGNMLHDIYDYSHSKDEQKPQPVPKNVLQPSNKQIHVTSASELFDNLTFTPLKSLPSKNNKLDKGPKIIISMNSDTDADDSLDIINSNKENGTHSFMCVTSSQQTNQWLIINEPPSDIQSSETPIIMNKKIPNTSSPKDLNSPNFSINTDFSRISDLSFFPQRFSTEKKILPKVNNETHEIVDESNTNFKFSSDTYTKESPNTPLDYHGNRIQTDSRYLPTFMRDQHPKMCRQSLFKEQHRDTIEKNYLARPEHYPWNSDLRADMKSPPRSLTPPLQSIPEESVQCSETQVLDKTDRHVATFTINRTFDKPTMDQSFMTANRKSSWSKRDIRAEPSFWKTPAPVPRKSTKPKINNKCKESLSGKSDQTLEIDKSVNESSYLKYIGNVYSQSFTVDPFLSSTYFYDKGAVENFQREFKRWLNCILTPPSDLDSNIEQQVDVGKIWIENRNKEVPVAPTKEQVCSAYHNSHRLESLRRSARSLLRSSEITQVFLKLNAQIEKKLITIRQDRNLHLDIGLQKIIMEILLSYNPLWLRIALEAIYGLVLPLKSNNDIEGLTSFVIQRMFKNPHLKNKHSKASAPNMLLPAYMEAIKKFTVKKFFILVFFLDQAKQKKMIPHDPCLFRRNAICKESKDIIIRFTRELIAGIGDITRHLRPLGYVVSHKQSYLDEYIYAVHNIAVDIRDGVRLTKVMEIILMRNDLLRQLRTPAISRLQKIHNVQVALNALKDANFVISGDITAADIADGHREKTLSLLWQIIHVFRAPLFEKAANVIQIWWRKKYVAIVEKRIEQERVLENRNTAASIIQYWWRRVQYNRMVEYEMFKITTATTIIQKYCRMWLCRSRLRKLKSSVAKISEWYKNTKMIQEAKQNLLILRLKRDELRNESATIIQAHYRRWLCLKKFKNLKAKVILIQSIIKRQLAMKRYNNLKKSIIYVQQKYKNKLLMRREMQNLAKKRECVVRIQSYFKMIVQRKYYKNLKKFVLTIEKHYEALILMRNYRIQYLKIKRAAVKVQEAYRRRKYLRQCDLIINVQKQIWMRELKNKYDEVNKAALVIQRRYRYRLEMREKRLKSSCITIQNAYRAYLKGKRQRHIYLNQKESAIKIQNWYRSLKTGKQTKEQYIKTKKACFTIQTVYRAYLSGKRQRQEYVKIKTATVRIQKYYRSYLLMKTMRRKYLEIRKSTVTIQQFYRSWVETKKQRLTYLRIRQASVRIQIYYRQYCMMKLTRQEYCKLKLATICIQQKYRSIIAMRRDRAFYLAMQRSAVVIQNRFRALQAMRTHRQQYLHMRATIITLQRKYKALYLMKKERCKYLGIIKACHTIQVFYRAYRKGVEQRDKYLQLKTAAVVSQRRFRAIVYMRKERQLYLNMRCAVLTIQKRFRAHQLMLRDMAYYRKLRVSCITIQQFYRAYLYGTKQRENYIKMRSSAVVIQKRYREYREAKSVRNYYVRLRTMTVFVQRRIIAKNNARKIARKMAVDKIQSWYTSIKQRNEARSRFIDFRTKVITVQAVCRAYICRKRYLITRRATTTIQNYYRCYKLTKYEKEKYIRIRGSIIKLQTYLRMFIERRRYQRLLSTTLTLQAVYRFKTYKIRMQKKRQEAAICIQKNVRCYSAQTKYKRYRDRVVYVQKLWRSKLITRLIRSEFLRKRTLILKLQATIKGYLARKNVQYKKEILIKLREEQRRNWAASKIQALFRGHRTRVASNARAAEMRRRWRNGGLLSSQESVKERNEDALEVLRNTWSGIQSVIRAFKSLELLTEVFPMMYDTNASAIVRRVYNYISGMNRSISSVEVIKSGASVLVNLTRYRITGPKIYARDRITPALKLMSRFSTTETHLFCILSTYIWLFSKYDQIKKDLTEFLHIPENFKLMLTIKRNIHRMKRMANNTRNKFNTPQPSKFISHAINKSLWDSSNVSMCSISGDNSYVLPALEPDYGITKANKPRYFEDAQHAIDCIFEVYRLL